MCFELDSLPPIPVIVGAAVSHEELTLEATDGNRFAAVAWGFIRSFACARLGSSCASSPK